MVVELNCNLLENICACMIVLRGQTLYLTGALLLFHWNNFVVMKEVTKIVKLVHLKPVTVTV